jgi:dipeptidyl aminopeptidase/acylaminoacyl peptidase
MPARRPPLSVDALWSIVRIGTPTLSPDGSLACSSATRYAMEKNEGATELWLYPTRPSRGARPRRLTAGDKDSGPAWSPDGRLIAFTAKRRDDEVPQVYVIAPDGGEARRVTTLATGCASVRWFADGRRLAFISWVWADLGNDAAQAKRLKERKETKVKVHATERAEYRYWDHWLTEGREPHVFVCDVATGRCRDALAGTGLSLPPWEPSTQEFDVAPDGREIAITADLADEPGMLHRTDVVTIDLATRRRRVLTAATGRSDGAPRYSPDGRVIAYTSHDTERSHVDQGHLELVARRGGPAQPVGTAFDRAVAQVQWAPDGRSLLFTAEDRGRTGVWRLSAGATRPTLVVPGGTVGGFAQSKDGRTIVCDRSTSQHPPALFACAGDGSDERALETTNAALLARHALGETREITVKGWSGEPVQVWLVYPPGFDPKRKWPLMHSIHGGPHAAHGDVWHFRWNAQVFAGRGYVVAMVNYHGSSGFGQAFLETIVARYGEKEFADIEAATDHLLRAGYVDRTRLVGTGGSYGGFMAAYMNGHTDRYTSYVCHAGCYDWVSMMATDGYMWFHRELGAWHWDDEARVLRQSPHHHVGRAKTPTLVVHGEQDFRVPATQALQYYHTLKAKGVEARLVYFPDENHWILKPQNSLRWYGEFFDWIARRAPGGGRAATRRQRRGGQPARRAGRRRPGTAATS